MRIVSKGHLSQEDKALLRRFYKAIEATIRSAGTGLSCPFRIQGGTLYLKYLPESDIWFAANYADLHMSLVDKNLVFYKELEVVDLEEIEAITQILEIHAKIKHSILI